MLQARDNWSAETTCYTVQYKPETGGSEEGAQDRILPPPHTAQRILAEREGASFASRMPENHYADSSGMHRGPGVKRSTEVQNDGRECCVDVL